MSTTPKEGSPHLARALRLFCWLALAWIAMVGALNLGLHYQVDATAAQKHFTTTEIEDGLRYGFESKAIGWCSRIVYFAFLAAMALTSLGARVTASCQRFAGGRWWLTVVLLALVLYLVPVLLGFPFSLMLFHLAHRWGMSHLGLGDWLIEYALGTAINCAMYTLPFIVLFFLIRWLPRYWWLVASGVIMAYGVAIALLYPVLVAPLFNTFTPLRETKWKDLEPGVARLLDRAGVEVDDILVMDASRQSSHTNAYFNGFGATRRIVVYDTLLKDHKPDEVLSVLGHEIGHWEHDHIVKGLALAGVGVFVACFLLALILRSLVNRPPWRLSSPSDPAGLPLVVLLVVLGNWLTTPVQNACSRYAERQADGMALELGSRDAFIDTEVKMGRTNKSNVTPHPFNVFLFSTHPTTLERIEMAESWRK